MSTAQLEMHFTKLTPAHAAAATRLHIAGQPGTFLTSLGPEVLAVFYRALPQSPMGFGFVARDDRRGTRDDRRPTTDDRHTGAAMIGFVAATTSTGRLFLELGTRQLPGFMPPLLRRFAQQPSLIGKAAQTLLYPFLHSGFTAATRRRGMIYHAPTTGSSVSLGHGTDAVTASGQTAELLAIMVEPAWRSQGVGAQLLAQLVDECKARDLSALDVTVDAANEGARRFYARHGFSEQGTFTLYGRAMCTYRLPIRR